MEAIMAEELVAALGPMKLSLLGIAFALVLVLPIAGGLRRTEPASAAVLFNAADPGAEDFVRRQIAGFQQGRPDYSQMAPELAAISREQADQVVAMMRIFGPLREVRFLGRDVDGANVFVVVFEKMRTLWAVTLSGGKVSRAGWGQGYGRETLAGPSPGTEASLRRYIASLQAGKPNLGEMTPGQADSVTRQAPTLIAMMQSFGALKSLTYKGVRAPGLDVYDARFARGHAEWMIAPLTPDGKVQARGFKVLP
jgi:hypothetical protein